MKAGENFLVKFMQQQDTQFIIPVYQRNYDWTRKHCEQLLFDIKEVAKAETVPSHFIGSIVYIYDDASRLPSDPYYLTIIDGQQRLTTITLLWLVLYQKAKEQHSDRLAEEIRKKYLVNEFLDGDAKIKLKPTQNNDAALQYLLQGDLSYRYPGYSNLLENFDFFYSAIAVEEIELVKQGIHKLLFVEISLHREWDNPQRIFESLNSTGLELSQGDLIRNYILMGLAPKQQQHIYKDYWMPIESSCTHKDTNHIDVSEFIRHYLTIKSRLIPNQAKVYETFKKTYPFRDFGSLELVLKDMKRFAAWYHNLLNPSEEDAPVICEHLQLINQLDINVSYPFILEVYDDYQKQRISQADLIEVLELIQSYVWRRFICGVPTNALNKVFLRLYEDIQPDEYVLSLQKALARKADSQRFPNDDEVRNELRVKNVYNIQSKNRMYFLERLENYGSKEPIRIAGNPEITIEHIFPQTPSLKWRQELSDVDYHEMEMRKNTIANLTLSGHNGPLGNKPFQEKRNLPGKGYQASKLFLNKYLASLEKWTPKELDARFELILQRFNQVWRYPELPSGDAAAMNMPLTDAINIFDIDDPSGKKPEYLLFFERKIPVKTFKEVYQVVLTDLFESYPAIFHESAIQDKLKYAPTAENLTNPVKINESYFVEANLSSSETFSRLKHVLEACQIDDDLYIKFRESGEHRVNQEQFLSAVDEHGKTVFQQIFEFAKQHGLWIRWGSKGFSLNLVSDNTAILLFLGYPPTVFGQSIYTGFEEIARKVNQAEEIITFYQTSLQRLGIFIPTQSKHGNLKWVLDKPYSEEQIAKFLQVIQQAISKIQEQGIKPRETE